MMLTDTITINQPHYLFKVKDYYSAFSHFIGFIVSVFLTPVLLIRAASQGASVIDLIWYSIFMMSLILLYGASASYHTFDISAKGNATLKRLDHAMIFILIAGSYTPVCMIALKGKSGIILCISVWAIAIIGILIKMFWIYCPKWFSSIIYISMGWACVFQLGNIYKTIPQPGFYLLLTGGIIYTIGGLLYPLKLNFFSKGYGYSFGMHELFHIFILAGSLFHYLMMYLVLTTI